MARGWAAEPRTDQPPTVQPPMGATDGEMLAGFSA